MDSGNHAHAGTHPDPHDRRSRADHRQGTAIMRSGSLQAASEDFDARRAQKTDSFEVDAEVVIPVGAEEDADPAKT